jgi:hypothetical protein
MTSRTERPSDTEQTARLHAQLLDLANQVIALPPPFGPSGRVVANGFLAATASLLCDRRLVPTADALAWVDHLRSQVEQTALDSVPDRLSDA